MGVMRDCRDKDICEPWLCVSFCGGMDVMRRGCGWMVLILTRRRGGLAEFFSMDFWKIRFRKRDCGGEEGLP